MTRDEELKLIDDFIAAGKMTRLPPGPEPLDWYRLWWSIFYVSDSRFKKLVAAITDPDD